MNNDHISHEDLKKELGLLSIGWRVSLYLSGITNIAMKSSSNYNTI